MATKSIDEILQELAKGAGGSFNTSVGRRPIPDSDMSSPVVTQPPLAKIEPKANLTPLQPLKPIESKLGSSKGGGSTLDRAMFMKARINQKPPSLRTPDEIEMLSIIDELVKLMGKGNATNVK